MSNKPKSKMMRLAPVILLVLLCLVALLPLIPTGQCAMFKNNKFEDNIAVVFNPGIPQEYETVNVTIRSLDSVPIISADLWIEIRGPLYTSSGAYSMNKINSTARYLIINGYAADTNVTFHITAYDGIKQLESNKYYYDVVAKASFKNDNFNDNVEFRWRPVPETPDDPWVKQAPAEEQDVELLIESKDLSVKLQRVDMDIRVQLPADVDALTSSVSFDKVDDYTFRTTIPAYPGGSTVSFNVTAYDVYWNSVKSGDESYTVDKLPDVYLFGIYVIVYNNITSQYMEANISVYDGSGYHVTGETVNGIYWSPTNLTDGWYTIKVVPDDSKEDVKTQRIEVTRHTTDFEFIVYYGVEDISTGYSLVNFPTTKVLVMMIIIFLLVPVALWLLKWQEKRVREEEKKKKKDEPKKPKKKGLLQRFKDQIWYNFERKKDFSTAIAFALLGFFASVWCPFYPWWMTLMITVVAGAIAYKFPYISLLFVSFVGIGATGFQSPQFGLLFMIFALFLCVCSLFNWKFGYLSFMTVFLSTFGLAFLIPVVSIFLFSLFVSITVTLVSGVFLSIVVATGNFVNLSFIVTSHVSSKESITTFSRDASFWYFTPQKYITAISDIRGIDLASMGSFIQNYLDTMVPLIQVLMWCLLVLVLYALLKKFDRSVKSVFKYAGVAFGVIMLTTIAGMLLADFGLGTGKGEIFYWQTIVTFLLSFFALVFAVGITFFLRNEYFEYYTEQAQVSIGTRVSEMQAFRKTSFSKVGGLKEVKAEIKNSLIGPLLKPELSKKYGVEPPRGMILFGPPGCGKTLLMRVIATELDVEMIGVKCSDIMSKWYGESENMINDLFRIAKEKKPCILFLDEIDAVAKRRDFYSADDVTPRLLSIMLSEMDGMDESTGIMIIGATNKPELIDPALLRPGRFDKVMYVPPPDFVGRQDILKIHLKGKPVAKDVDLKMVARATDGYSGADIANLTKECAQNAMRRSVITKKPTKIKMSDFKEMTTILKPSMTQEMKMEYERLQADYERKMKKKSVKKASDKAVVKKEGLEAVGGMKQLKEYFGDLVTALKDTDGLMKDYGISARPGVLLFGPSGCGKRKFLSALAGEHDMTILKVTGSELKDRFQQKKGGLKELFNRAKATAPSIILIEDLHDLTTKDALSKDKIRIGYDQLVKSIDSLKPQDRVIIVATSMFPLEIDHLIIQPERFQKLIHVGLPDIETRKEIFDIELKELVDIKHIDTMLLALRTEGFSGRDIVNVVDNAKMIAISAAAPKKKVQKGAALDRALQDLLNKAVDKKLVLTFDHVLKAVERYEPVISRRSIRSCERFIEENTMDLGSGVGKTSDVSELLMVEKRTIEKKARAELEAMKSAQAEEIKDLLEEERKKVMERLQQEKEEMDKIHKDKLRRLKDKREEEVESMLKKEKIRYKKEMEKLKSEKEEEVKKTLAKQRKKLQNEMKELEMKMNKEKELQKKKAMAETQKRLQEEEAKLEEMRRKAAKKAAERKAQKRAKDARRAATGGMEWDEEDEDDEDEVTFDSDFVSWD